MTRPVLYRYVDARFADKRIANGPYLWDKIQELGPLEPGLERLPEDQALEEGYTYEEETNGG